VTTSLQVPSPRGTPMVRKRSVHPLAATQGRCQNASQRASPPSSARDACPLRSSTSTWLSPYGCRTGHTTRVPCSYPPGCRRNEKCVCVISMRIKWPYDDYYLPEPLESHREHEGPCPCGPHFSQGTSAAPTSSRYQSPY